MKYSYLKIYAPLLAVVLASSWGCTAGFERINTNPNQVTKEQLTGDNYDIGSTITTLEGMVVSTQQHLYQFYELMVGCAFGGYAGETNNGWLNKFSTFNPELEWQKGPFKTTMDSTYPPYRSIIALTDDPVALAMAKILRVAVMHRLADSYGPIPYTKVMEDKHESLTVGYDSQKEAYLQMLKELDEAWQALDENRTLPSDAFAKFDNVYGGNIQQWLRYCASLKLRMAMRLTYVNDPDIDARALAEDAVSKGVITDNADNANLKVETNYSTECWYDWADHRVAADIICYMNGYNDPRRAAMFTSPRKDADGNPVYVGIRRGIFPHNKDSYVGPCSNSAVSVSSPYLWMNAAEVAFLRAEGALRGWDMGGKAEDFYNRGIELSFEEHNVAKAADAAAAYAADNTAKPEAYTDPVSSNSASAPSTVTVKWAAGTDAATDELNLEKIITQKWIAMFPLGLEAWAEYRRTGYPRLFPAVENKSGGSVDSKLGARRLNYPADEYQENRSNVEKAVSEYLSGPDNMGTRLWWDKRNLN